LELVRYIHLNPVRAGLVRQIDRYRWSSHLGYLRGKAEQAGVFVNDVLKQFGQKGKNSNKACLTLDFPLDFPDPGFP
jgi:hypothetical protein